jgi:hypothetical protein
MPHVLKMKPMSVILRVLGVFDDLLYSNVSFTHRYFRALGPVFQRYRTEYLPGSNKLICSRELFTAIVIEYSSASELAVGMKLKFNFLG